MNSGMEFYRLRFEYTGEDSEGKLITQKQEDLVVAVNYTDAETIASEIMADMNMTKFYDRVKYEIIKTKISEIMLTDVFFIDEAFKNEYILYYLGEEEEEDDETGLFAVTVVYTEINDNGKSKKTKEDIYVAATNPKEAYTFVQKYLKYAETRDWAIRNVKFDKASSVLITKEMHKSNLYKYENAGLL